VGDLTRAITTLVVTENRRGHPIIESVAEIFKPIMTNVVLPLSKKDVIVFDRE